MDRGFCLSEQRLSGYITSIRKQSKNPDRVSIDLDGKFAIGLSKRLAVDLKVGQPLDDQSIANLLFQDEKAKLVQQAMRLLQRRPRSRKELGDYYRKKGVADSLCSSILDYLAELGLVDDREFANVWIENRQAFRPRGERALRFELRQKGIAAEIIDEALEGFDEVGAAKAAAAVAWRRYRHLSVEEYMRKALPYMARRGFPYEIGAKTIKQVRNERLNEENESEVST
jgi:regulatory protein